MGFFDSLRGADTNEGVREWQQSDGGVLLDVRTQGEYQQGHIPGSINIPGDSIYLIDTEVPDKETPLYVYCLSGYRSGQAVDLLKQLGYAHATNIGGIQGYSGKVEV